MSKTNEYKKIDMRPYGDALDPVLEKSDKSNKEKLLKAIETANMTDMQRFAQLGQAHSNIGISFGLSVVSLSTAAIDLIGRAVVEFGGDAEKEVYEKMREEWEALEAEQTGEYPAFM